MRHAFSFNSATIVIAIVATIGCLLMAIDDHAISAILIFSALCVYLIVAAWLAPDLPRHRGRAGRLETGIIYTVLLVVVFGYVDRFIWNSYQEKELEKPIGTLKPDNIKDDPARFCGTDLPVNGLRVYCGNVLAFVTIFPQIIVQFQNSSGIHPVLVIDKKSGDVLIKHLDIWDRNSKFVAGIEDGILHVNRSNSSYFKRTNSTLVVKDEWNDEVLNIHYLNPSAISITGILRYGRFTPYIFSDGKTEIPGSVFEGTNCIISLHPGASIFMTGPPLTSNK